MPMSAGLITVIVTIATYLIMVAGFFLSGRRRVHITIMATVMVYDLLMPFYLFLTRDWYARLIGHEDILTFGVWMHFMVVLVLYVLYVFQILAARKILADPHAAAARREHRQQAIAILLVRAFVIFTGALLVNPEYEK
jgi:heme exporter protein D